MGPVRVGSSTLKGRRCYNIFTGPTLGLLLLFFVAGADCWSWGSVKSCPPGEEPVCPKNPTNDTENYFPHPTDCHYYVQCDSNGRAICRRCSPTTYFSPSLANCVWPLEARCEHNATTRQSSLLPPICVPDRDEENGSIYYPEPCEDSTDCRYYYYINCTERAQCPPNQHFNKKSKRCEDQCVAGCKNPSEIPECRQCPREGEILNYQCEYYMICTNGIPEQIRCNNNEHFDLKSKKCISGPCCEDRPDPKNCSFYITNCVERKQCPPNQHYSKKNKQCENVCTAGCQNPENILQCRECEFEGEILKHNCESYIMCRNGKAQIIKCDIMEHFDEKAGKCLPGSCCEDEPDPNNCGYYITNCNQQVPCPPNQHYNRQTKHCEHICTAGCQNPLEIPQCRQCPKDGEILSYDCQYYTICRNGIPEQVNCGLRQHFDVTAQKCIPGPCCEDKPDPNDCNYYITNCNKRVRCPPNTHYSKQTKRCENMCVAGCQNPQVIPWCIKCQEGEILQYDCQYYTICRNGKLEQIKCNANQHFDKAVKKCVPGPCCEDKPDPNECGYYITNCDQRVPCPPNTHYNKQTKRCEDECVAGCQNPQDIPRCKQCQEGQILQYDCQYYTICRNGKSEQIKCNANQHFDKAVQRCVPGSCCEDKPDPNECGYYITNCDQRVPCPPNTHYNKQTKRCEDECVAGCQNPQDIPRCKQCQEGQILQYDCQYYTICRNGKSEQIKCNANQHFDKAVQRCVPGSCCEDKPDPNECGYYITNCDQRVPCPPNTHYNKQTKRCEDECVAGCQNPQDIPRCKQCQEGQILQYDCQYYTICRNGKPEQIKCNANQHFDKAVQRCVPGSCCENKPDPNDCGYYITNCDQRVPCPPNTHYNKQTKRCEDECVAGCQNPQDIPRCKQCQEGQILQYDCQYYTICRNGKSEQIKCNANQHFDKAVQRCVPGSCCENKPDPNDCGYYITNCDQRVPCPPNTHYNKQTKRCEDECVAGCQNPQDIPRCKQCQEGQILQYDCQYYTICRNGKPEQIKCNANQHFDKAVQRCVPGSCCENKPDPNDCGYYITNCDQRVPCPPNTHYNKQTKRCEDECVAGCQNPQDIPRCKQCQEGQILQYDCQYYTICRNGKSDQIKCNANQHFDKAVQRCVPGSCCENKPDPNDCGYYITNCDQRVPCPPNTHYNKQTKRCEDECVAGCQNPQDIPRCKQCQEGQILQYDCQYYTICRNGKPEQIKCNANQHFDKAVQRCVPGSCCENKPDPNDCGYYITNCDQRVPCPPNTHYNKQTKRCEDECVAGCQNPQDIPRCKQCQEGQILQYDCQYYTICRNGKSDQIKCSANQHFDKAVQRCVPGSCCENKPDPNDCGYYITNCDQRVPCPPNTHYNKQTKRCEDECVAGCQNPQDIPRCKQCQEGQILQYDCQYYTICRNGKPEQIKCNANQHFDKAVQRCVPGSCCENKPDPNDCGYYITNCDQRVPCPPNTHYNKQTKRCEDECVAGCQNPQDIPRCKQCQEGQILQYDCQYYTICRNGKPEQIKCNANQHFDKAVQRCVPGSCCENKPDLNDCGYYITNCNQRVACPPNQHFNKQTKKCENICTAGCQNPQEIQECTRCPEGKILQSECQYYVICRNGIPEQIKCNLNERFDLNARRCVPGSCCVDKPDPNDCGYYITNCNQRTACPPNQHYNKYNKRCEDKCIAGCVDASLIPGCQGECEEGKTYEDPCSCDMYYICENGKKVLTMCNEGLHYNRTLSHCDAPCNNVCVKLFARNPECCASTKGKPEPNCSATKLPLFLPHPSDSRWFYQCIDGVVYCNRCPPGHRWNIDTDTCDNTCQCP